jgi:ElaB/YqjD/DUF883 family membrane-anchored ribosome-binding protein
VVDADTLREITHNTIVLRDLEAKLSSIASFGGVQNSKAAEKAQEEIATVREQSDKALREAEDRFDQTLKEEREKSQSAQ